MGKSCSRWNSGWVVRWRNLRKRATNTIAVVTMKTDSKPASRGSRAEFKRWRGPLRSKIREMDKHDKTHRYATWGSNSPFAVCSTYLHLQCWAQMGRPDELGQQGPSPEPRCAWRLSSQIQTASGRWGPGSWGLCGLAEMKRWWGALWAGGVCPQWWAHAAERWCSASAGGMKGRVQRLKVGMWEQSSSIQSGTGNSSKETNAQPTPLMNIKAASFKRIIHQDRTEPTWMRTGPAYASDYSTNLQ